MPIEPITGAHSLVAATRARRRQTGFEILEPDAEAVAQAPAEASAATQMSLLTLQAAGMADAQVEADRAAIVRGETLLGTMRDLQLAMLGGDTVGDRLDALSEDLPGSADPALNDVLRAIAQRAAIERARRA